MKHLGWPAILAIAVVGIVLAGLGGALIANATTTTTIRSRPRQHFQRLMRR